MSTNARPRDALPCALPQGHRESGRRLWPRFVPEAGDHAGAAQNKGLVRDGPEETAADAFGVIGSLVSFALSASPFGEGVSLQHAAMTFQALT